MKVKNLPEKTKYLWQIRCIAFYLLLIALCAYFYPYYKFLLFAGAVITVACIVTVLWYIPRFIGSYIIYFSKESVVIKRGVVIKTTHIMPFSRLIYTQTFTTPTAKLLGLTAVTLKAARSRLIIPEMSLEDAKLMIETLG